MAVAADDGPIRRAADEPERSFGHVKIIIRGILRDVGDGPQRICPAEVRLPGVLHRYAGTVIRAPRRTVQRILPRHAVVAEPGDRDDAAGGQRGSICRHGRRCRHAFVDVGDGVTRHLRDVARRVDAAKADDAVGVHHHSRRTGVPRRAVAAVLPLHGVFAENRRDGDVAVGRRGDVRLRGRPIRRDPVDVADSVFGDVGNAVLGVDAAEIDGSVGGHHDARFGITPPVRAVQRILPGRNAAVEDRRDRDVAVGGIDGVGGRGNDPGQRRQRRLPDLKFQGVFRETQVGVRTGRRAAAGEHDVAPGSPRDGDGEFREIGCVTRAVGDGKERVAAGLGGRDVDRDRRSGVQIVGAGRDGEDRFVAGRAVKHEEERGTPGKTPGDRTCAVDGDRVVAAAERKIADEFGAAGHRNAVVAIGGGDGAAEPGTAADAQRVVAGAEGAFPEDEGPVGEADIVVARSSVHAVRGGGEDGVVDGSAVVAGAPQRREDRRRPRGIIAAGSVGAGVDDRAAGGQRERRIIEIESVVIGGVAVGGRPVDDQSAAEVLEGGRCRLGAVPAVIIVGAVARDQQIHVVIADRDLVFQLDAFLEFQRLSRGRRAEQDRVGAAVGGRLLHGADQSPCAVEPAVGDGQRAGRFDQQVVDEVVVLLLVHLLAGVPAGARGAAPAVVDVEEVVFGVVAVDHQRVAGDAGADRTARLEIFDEHFESAVGDAVFPVGFGSDPVVLVAVTHIGVGDARESGTVEEIRVP